MDSKKPKATVTEEEADYVHTALEEWKRYGATTRRCPRCGGELQFNIIGNSYRILCEKKDFSLTGRGL